jgi:hypothetical protein
MLANQRRAPPPPRETGPTAGIPEYVSLLSLARIAHGPGVRVQCAFLKPEAQARTTRCLSLACASGFHAGVNNPGYTCSVSKISAMENFAPQMTLSDAP